ncbi:hypothetical protein THRCLA_00058 [Thraustotheca clavata]|uniref:Uncharacterized protein n=1 Tax=Thraustotheca clavata TaxID=74557 RepID=A0A1W0ACB6_9STRA|nr:hypothetical protein THRCLA_00058 [Thraustotheca clavata]
MAPPGLLLECQKQLEISTFEYNQSLAQHVFCVWQSLGKYIEMQLMQSKASFLPVFGKFTFLKGKVNAPAFLFSDKFLKSFPRIVTKRPLPALTVHGADTNYSTIAADANVMKDQAQSIIEAIFKTIGEATESGVRSARLAFGNLGHIVIEGKCIHFRFDSAFVSRLGGTNNSITKAVPTTLETLEAMAGLRESPSINKPTPVLKQPAVAFNNYLQEPKTEVKIKQVEKRKTKRPSPQLVKCASDSIVGITPTILPRFLIPDHPRASRATSVVQNLIVEQAYARLDSEIQAHNERKAALEREYEARAYNAEIRTLKHRAEKAISQRDTSAHLTQQVSEKLAREEQAQAIQTLDLITILPQPRIRSKSEEKTRKAHLMQQLHDQVKTKNAREDQRQRVQRDEERFFLENVHRQDEVEKKEAAERKQLEKETLLKEWSRQMSHK